jgi:hypothetical protein
MTFDGTCERGGGQRAPQEIEERSPVLWLWGGRGRVGVGTASWPRRARLEIRWVAGTFLSGLKLSGERDGRLSLARKKYSVVFFF